VAPAEASDEPEKVFVVADVFEDGRGVISNFNFVSGGSSSSIRRRENSIWMKENLERKKITKQTLEKSVKLANKYGLSKMTMEEIDDEIKAHRNAKNNS